MKIEQTPSPEQLQEEQKAQEEAASRKDLKVHYSFKEQWQKFKALPPGERFWYIWEYYKIHILVILAIVIMGWMFIDAIIKGTRTTVLEGVMVNINYNAEDTAFLEEDYLKVQGINPQRNVLNLDSNLFINENSTGDYELASLTKITALIQLNELDFIITEQFGYDYYAEGGYFADLSKILPQDLFEELEEENRILYGEVCLETDDAGNPSVFETRPMAILLDDTYCDEQLDMINENVYFCVVFNTKRSEELVPYIKYLLGE